MTFPLYPVLLDATYTVTLSTARALADVRMPRATLSSEDRIIATVLPIAQDPLRGPQILFHASALMELDQDGIGATLQTVPSSMIPQLTTPAGQQAWAQGLAGFMADTSACNTLLQAAGEMMEAITPIAHRAGIPLAAYYDLCIAIIPEGAILYPEWLGELARILGRGRNPRALPPGLVRALPCAAPTSHGVIHNRYALHHLITQMAALPPSVGWLTPKPFQTDL